jgi:hypothetical protein
VSGTAGSRAGGFVLTYVLADIDTGTGQLTDTLHTFIATGDAVNAIGDGSVIVDRRTWE